MFTERISERIDYHTGSLVLVPANQEGISLETRRNNTLLLSAYMTVQENCEKVCETSKLGHLHEQERTKIVENSRIGQSYLKHFESKVVSDFESCVKKCFVERLQRHFGDSEEVRNYIFQTAFEYDQREINHFRFNDYRRMPNTVNVNLNEPEVQKRMFENFNREL